MTFREKLEKRIATTGSNLCVGLDVRMDQADETTKRFIIKVIEETAPHAAAFKPNSAYYEAMGWKGMRI
ncbi:MAG TPA: orotidine-5'-phosphate decarboxylase, partial [Verrucomicrobiales bacterium]|nr:orotidine-5'-phosphate decarboxylase [Verrucomicrobiales bacterium]